VILQGEMAEDEEDVAAPLGVVGGLKIKNDRDEVLDVLDGGSLSVEVGDGRCFRGGGVDVVILRIGVVVQMLGAEAIPEGRGLLLQGICLRALFVKSSRSGVDTLLGGGGGLEKGSFFLELLAALCVGGAQRGGLMLQALGSREGFVAELGRGSHGGGAGGGHGRAQQPGVGGVGAEAEGSMV